MTCLSSQIIHTLSDVLPEAWDACANPDGQAYDPFLSWAFLQALEETEAVSRETGWLPHHVLIRDETDALLGAMPLYLKTHSQGEFVFDHGWADAFERAGGQYYPKLLSAVPFTPVTGRRRLVRPGPEATDVGEALISTAVSLAESNGLSSVHFNFWEDDEQERLANLGFLKRHDQQFHWFNDGYASFDDFLGTLSSQKRKNLRKERAKAQEGLMYRRLTGDDIKEHHLDVFYAFYMDTGARKWGSPYLNRDTFSLLKERLADHMVIVMAEDDGAPIAGALNFAGSEALFGRYWGRLEDSPFLHFETCYYQAIDHAIELGLKKVEAGAQGGHKLARGYVPVQTSSAHWITHPGFRSAVEDYLDRERDAVSQEIDYLKTRTPFRKES